MLDCFCDEVVHFVRWFIPSVPRGLGLCNGMTVSWCLAWQSSLVQIWCPSGFPSRRGSHCVRRLRWLDGHSQWVLILFATWTRDIWYNYMFTHLVKSSHCTYHLHFTQTLWCGIYSSVFAVVGLTLLRVIVTVLWLQMLWRLMATEHQQLRYWLAHSWLHFSSFFSVNNLDTVICSWLP